MKTLVSEAISLGLRARLVREEGDMRLAHVLPALQETVQVTAVAQGVNLCIYIEKKLDRRLRPQAGTAI
ncbi:MAG: hypothetical protein ACREX4_16010, partial [Gammaproteobacteria bacterium]